MRKYVKNKVFSGNVIPSEKDKILEFNQFMKSDKMPHIIYADIESLIKKKKKQMGVKKIFNNKNR